MPANTNETEKHAALHGDNKSLWFVKTFLKNIWNSRVKHAHREESQVEGNTSYTSYIIHLTEHNESAGFHLHIYDFPFSPLLLYTLNGLLMPFFRAYV